MKSPSFEITINSKIIAVGAIDAENASMTILTSWMKKRPQDPEELTLDFGGYNVDEDDQFRWIKKELKIGDTITIKIGGYVEPSPIISRYEKTAEDIVLKSKIEYYYRLKEELKGHI
jgi:hypothetical protein